MPPKKKVITPAATGRLSVQDRIKLMLKKSDSYKVAEVLPYDICPTRVPEMNELLPGGWPRGKVCLTFGSPSSGKSTVAVETIADLQKADPDHITFLIPSERGEDLQYYYDLGLDMDRTIIMRKKHYILEEVMEEIQDILSDASIGIGSILVDSWDGLVGYKEMYTPDGVAKDAVKDTVAAKAAGASKMWKRIKGLIADTNVLFLIIAQVRTKGLGGYIVTEWFSGGFALEHNIDVAIQQTLAGIIKEKKDGQEVIVGQKVRLKVVKSKVNGNSHKTAEVNYIFGESWDQITGLWNLALASGIIEKNGGWYSYEGFPANASGDHKLQGEAKAKDFFNNPSARSSLVTILDYVQANINATEVDINRVVTTTLASQETLDVNFFEEEDEPAEES